MAIGRASSLTEGLTLFRRTKALESQIDEFLDKLSESAILFRRAVGIYLDEGACKALVQGGKSLLPSGIVEVRGSFGVGAPVQCLDEEENVIATGLSNYSRRDLEKIKGLKTADIEKTLGYKDSDEVIHRDNLVILQGSGTTINTM